MKKISLFTPCYNEAGNLREMYERVTSVMKTLTCYEYEYVLIDNCSTDGTREILREIAAKDKRVKVIFNMKNYGPSRSGSYGFFQTSGDVSICFACDFQDPPELIPQFIKQWERGSKIVWGRKIGSDEKKGMYAIRCLYYKIIKALSENEQYENVTGFGLYDKEVVDLLKKYSGPNPNFRNMISEFGYDVAFVDYHQPIRKSGKSSYNFLKYFGVAIGDMVSTSRVPIRIATYWGLVVSFFSFLAAIIYLILKLVFWDNFSVGVAPLIIGMFFIGSVQILFIGVIGEYVGEILNRLIDRPMVVEQERINFKEKEL